MYVDKGIEIKLSTDRTELLVSFRRLGDKTDQYLELSIY